MTMKKMDELIKSNYHWHEISVTKIHFLVMEQFTTVGGNSDPGH